MVLGHAHVDHRGAAHELGDVPVLCHPAERAEAEGDGGLGYVRFELLPPHARVVYPRLFKLWDGGPVEIAGTVDEGDDVSGFSPVHLPGHAPGQVALFRERDGVALTTDVLLHARHPHRPGREAGARAPRLPAGPRAGPRLDPELAGARASSAWPGHAEPVTGDVAAELRAAAERLMGKRSRRRGARGALAAPESEYTSAGRRRPGAARRDDARHAARVRRRRRPASPLSREDAWQRAVEFLFERLAVRWEIAGTEPITRQKELLGRFRFATAEERRWIRDVLREHLAEHFPELEAP